MDLRRYVHLRNDAGRPRPRARRKRRTAFVLSGGGVLGAIQVGQLRALVERGIRPDLVVGTSVGAVNGAAISALPTTAGIERLSVAWQTLRTEDLFPGNRMQRAWSLVRKGDHLYENSGLRKIVGMLEVTSFEELEIPLHVGAANLVTGKEHWFWSGEIVPAILASAAIPGVFPPVAHEGELFVDGGVVNNVPLERAVELGATTIYVLSCGSAKPTERPIRRPLDVFVQAVARTRAARLVEDVERFSRHATIHVLPAVETGPIRFNDLSHSPRLINASYEAASAHLGERNAVRV